MVQVLIVYTNMANYSKYRHDINLPSCSRLEALAKVFAAVIDNAVSFGFGGVVCLCLCDGDMLRNGDINRLLGRDDCKTISVGRIGD